MTTTNKICLDAMINDNANNTNRLNVQMFKQKIFVLDHNGINGIKGKLTVSKSSINFEK